MRLRGNSLSGQIPASIGNLGALLELEIAGNQLTGGIPPEIGNLTALVFADLGNNQLSGGIPVEIGNLSNLTNLRLEENQLGGEIPEEVGDLGNLNDLRLNKNQFTGSIPGAIGKLDQLSFLSMDNNQLSGQIPSEISQLVSLRYLFLSNNMLSGEIPDEVGTLTGLEDLRLSTNQVSGPIPESIGNMVALRSLWLDNNPALTGVLPYTLIRLTSLGEFVFNNTGLCESSDLAFQAWLQTITRVESTGCVVDVSVDEPHGYSSESRLEAPYPNPFANQTSITYSIAQPDLVTLRVYNILGETIVTLEDRYLSAGEYTARFDAAELAPGVYLYTLSAGDFTWMRKMVLLR